MNRVSVLKQQPWLLIFLAIAALTGLCLVMPLNVTGLFSYFIEHNRYYNFFGIITILALATAFSYNRAFINIKLICTALLMHITLAVIMLKTSYGQALIGVIANGVNTLYQAADSGIEFIFGSLAQPQGPWGFIFAFKVLPIIIFFGALMSLLYHMGIIQKIVSFIGNLIQPLLGTSGAETLCAIANSFLGQTESPLLIRNYLKSMTKSEFLLVMVSGMGTISGSILAVFVSMGIPAKHLLTSCIMAIPATIIFAKILCPETDEPVTLHGAHVSHERTTKNSLDAIAQGTSDGLQLALNVGAMLVAFVALITMFNGMLFFICTNLNTIFSYFNSGIALPMVTLESIFSWLCLPFAWFLGFTGSEALSIGELLGTKIAINELVAYKKIATMTLSERGSTLVTYALCGFSNFSCIGIQIGGIGALVPEKKAWLSQLGLRAVLGGALANLLSAFVVGLLI